MNPVDNILGISNCPHCGKQMSKYKDSGFKRGYYLACENKQCSYRKYNDNEPYLNL